MFFRQVSDNKLAQYAYIIGCQKTGEAIVVDPMRNVDHYINIATANNLRITAATETHIHADFLSGVREMAERGIRVYLSDEGGADWRYGWAGEPYDSQLIKDGDTFEVGRIQFRVMHTPGHTPEHVCFLVTDVASGSSDPMGLVSGDFVFVGDVGRPDLLETAAGVANVMESSARTLYSSLRRFRELPPFLQVWPGHGAGSACGKDLGAVPMSTVGYELGVSPALRHKTENDFVSWVLDGQPEPPLYFGRMKRENRDGPAVLGSLPTPRAVRTSKLTELCDATGVAVLDTRSWQEYRHAHLPGSLFTPMGNAFNTVAGCYVPAGMPIYLLINEERVREAVVDLIHVGLDNVVGFATPDMFAEYAGSGGKVASIKEVPAEELDERRGEDVFLLDVRRDSEREDGVIAGSHGIAHTRLLDRIAEVPKDRPVMVHCQRGIRSCYASGLLDRHGYKVTNVSGGFLAWKRNGGAVEVPG